MISLFENLLLFFESYIFYNASAIFKYQLASGLPIFEKINPFIIIINLIVIIFQLITKLSNIKDHLQNKVPLPCLQFHEKL